MVDFEELAEGIRNAGISMFVNVPHPYGGQTYKLAPEELEAVIRDPVGYSAKRFGVSKDHYLRWLEYIQEPYCMALTRQNRPCRSPFSDLEDIATPDKFDPNRVYLCPIHADHTEKVTLQEKVG